MMHPANNKKNYSGYVLLLLLLAVLLYLLLESRQRTKRIDNILKQTITNSQE
jgi:hypothetical protein